MKRQIQLITFLSILAMGLFFGHQSLAQTAYPISPFIFTTPSPMIGPILASSSFKLPSLGTASSNNFVRVNSNGVFFIGGVSSTPSTTPGGSNTQVQVNENGAFAGYPTFTFNSSTGLLITPSISSTNALFINVSSTNLFASALTFTMANGTSITSTNAFFTNLIATNILTTNLTTTNASLTTVNFGTASGTSITTTNAFATNLGTTNFSAINGLFTNLTSTNSNFTNLSFTNASGTTLTSTSANFGTVNTGGGTLGAAYFKVTTAPLSPDAFILTDGVSYTIDMGRDLLLGGAYFGGLAGSPLSIYTNGSTQVRITLAGDVGINTTSPIAKLAVDGTAYFTQTTTMGTSSVLGGFFQTGLSDCSADTQTVNYNATTGKFTCLTDDTGTQRVGTSTANYFTFYDGATSVTGTSWVQFVGGALTITTNTNFTIVSSTSGLFGSVTTTNLTVTGALSLPNDSVTDVMVVAGLTISGGSVNNSPIGASIPSTGVFTNLTSTNSFATSSITVSATTTNLAVTGALSLPANSITDAMVVAGLTISGGTIDNSPIGNTVASTGIFTNLTSTNFVATSITTTNLYVSGSLSLPANSITDAMVVAGLTINGGTIDNSPIGNTTPSTGIFTNVTTTNLFATNTLFVNATTTNLFATTLTFTNASGTSLTSTNAVFTNLTFTSATGTNLYLSTSFNVNNKFTVDSSGNVSASGTVKGFGSATFGSLLTDFVAFQKLPVNQTTTTIDYLSDPEIINRGTGVNTTLATYSDNINRIWIQNTAAGASGIVSLKNRSVTPANTNLDGYYDNAGTLQTITATTLSGGGGAATVRGVVTYQGYDYLLIVNGGTVALKRATSTSATDGSVLASWVSATISGFTFGGSELGLVGAANGNIYMASNTTDIVPFAITTSTNTLTKGTSIVLTGMINALNCTRVNDNGIYTCAGSAPFVRQFDFSGNAINTYGQGFGAAAPLTSGPSIFVTQHSLYTAKGSATGLSKQ